MQCMLTDYGPWFQIAKTNRLLIIENKNSQVISLTVVLIEIDWDANDSEISKRFNRWRFTKKNSELVFCIF